MKKEFIVKCKKCGKEFSVIEEETKFPIKGDKYFCCRSCANSRGKRSQETKDKIRKTLKDGISNHKYILKNQFGEYTYGNRICKCEQCQKDFISDKNKRFCSDECRHNHTSILISKLRNNEIKNGIFQGWKSRNITSYAEKFWKKVLDNNNIKYIREYIFEYGNKRNGERYFLDFYIEINNRKIDLEIDGKQHLYEDRKEADKIRDEYIKSKGIEVYRILWNEINSEVGKQKMKEKINNFLEYYNKGVV